MGLSYFTVVAKYSALIPDYNDEGNEPDTQDITTLVTFAPSIKEARVSIDGTPTTIRLEPLIGRVNEDGVLRTLDDTIGVGLLCGDGTEGEALYGLVWSVSFSHTVYNKRRDQRIEPFSFLAPTTAATLNLAEVERT